MPSPASLLLICRWPLGIQCSLCLLREKPVKQPRQVFSPGVHPFSGMWEARTWEVRPREAERLSQGCRLAGGRAALHQPALPSCGQSQAVSPAHFSPMKDGDAGRQCERQAESSGSRCWPRPFPIPSFCLPVWEMGLMAAGCFSGRGKAGVCVAL